MRRVFSVATAEGCPDPVRSARSPGRSVRARLRRCRVAQRRQHDVRGGRPRRSGAARRACRCGRSRRCPAPTKARVEVRRDRLRPGAHVVAGGDDRRVAGQAVQQMARARGVAADAGGSSARPRAPRAPARCSWWRSTPRRRRSSRRAAASAAASTSRRIAPEPSSRTLRRSRASAVREAVQAATTSACTPCGQRRLRRSSRSSA